MSLNYQWLAKAAKDLGGDNARVLDFGCGVGKAVLAIRTENPNMDIVGTDTYEGNYEIWAERIHPDVRDLVQKVPPDTLPFPDNSFDVVYANQVFEHVFKPKPSLAEISRVLKPGGKFLALFPCKGTWYEGHVGVYFAHWLMGKPAALRKWLNINHAMGRGLYRGKQTRPVWVEQKATILEDLCIYHSWADFRQWMRPHFKAEIEHLEYDNIAFRLEKSPLSFAAPLARITPLRWVANLIHRLRGGRVFVMTKPETTAPSVANKQE